MTINTYESRGAARWRGVAISSAGKSRKIKALLRSVAEAVATAAEAPVGGIQINEKSGRCVAYVRLFQGDPRPGDANRLDFACRVAEALTQQ